MAYNLSEIKENLPAIKVKLKDGKIRIGTISAYSRSTPFARISYKSGGVMTESVIQWENLLNIYNDGKFLDV